MPSLTITDTPIAGVKVIQRTPRRDERGALTRLFCQQELAEAGWHQPIAQINHTLTCKQGVVRGMHFQYSPYAEMKLISCIRGAVWDVALDMRENSPTFLQWYAHVLSAENVCALLLPEGVAHGFQVLQANAELIYCHSAPYMPEAEAGLHPLDPRLAISWPLAPHSLSARDQQHPMLEQGFTGVKG
ncbi:dTDP-4-dehydrorhamnose 3,5-epimerase family protein [Pokkaliibacter sp. MBI-7]|uniref:dTDP-4-dehydrorhamnose 3,5-epimerase family protein n=1 Tax=Pokkaliibacter sp. MBI-7 TaxID=3040600 RepID=UPI0024471FAB|nr:dTDP-4-dehydrorhamnose 3,5-epimerase family protein [Pokkaliibacter sp. MBI-7]MDH2431288.1 dTDP-4-dehydrorhamnose 3,5-epimerase family protein [Pokkaliibacter sp. MBI-7]